MTGVRIHGVLLLIVLAWAFQTWTRERPTAAQRQRMLVWDRDTSSVTAIDYRSARRHVRVTRRSQDGEAYLWGEEIVRRPRPASVAEGAQDVRADTLRYPLGIAGDKLLADLSELRVLRDLGSLDADELRELGLEDPSATVTIEFDDGLRDLHLGRTVFGGSDRYAWDPTGSRGLVVPADVIRPLETGSGALRERALHGFSDSDVVSVRIEARGERRVLRRVSAGPGSPAAWLPADSPQRPDPALSGFMERVGQLAIDGFEPDLSPDALQRLLRVEYLDGRGEPLGFVTLYRDPTDPERDLYLLMSERTRIVARAFQLLAERVVREIPALF